MFKRRKKKKRKNILIEKLKWLPQKKLFLSILGGFLFFLTSPPFEGWFLAFIMFIPLFLIEEEEKSSKKIFFYGWIYGLVAYLLGFFWLIDTITIFGEMPWGISFLIFLLFSAFFALKFGIFFWLSDIFRSYQMSHYLSYGTALLIVEIFFPEIFPFYTGNSQLSNFYFIQIIDVFGIKGMSFIVIIINYLFYYFILNRDKRVLITLSSLLFIIYSYGLIRNIQVQQHQEYAKKLSIGLIQPDTPFLPGITFSDIQKINHTVLDLTHKLFKNNEKPLDLVVWPESATPFQVSGKGYLGDAVRSLIQQTGASFIVNEINLEAYQKGEPLHSIATLIDSDGKVKDTYAKVFLLPFGEYLPLSSLFPSLNNLFPQVGNFQPGKEIKNFDFKGFQLSPLICYEIIHPDFVRQFIIKGGKIIINLTNDKWFGETSATFRHLWLLIPRAIENRVAIVRATNSGTSTFIDQTGKIIAGPTEIFKQAVLKAEVSVIPQIFALYTYTGDWLLFLVIIYTLYWVIRNWYFFRKYEFYEEDEEEEKA